MIAFVGCKWACSRVAMVAGTATAGGWRGWTGYMVHAYSSQWHVEDRWERDTIWLLPWDDRDIDLDVTGRGGLRWAWRIHLTGHWVIKGVRWHRLHLIECFKHTASRSDLKLLNREGLGVAGRRPLDNPHGCKASTST